MALTPTEEALVRQLLDQQAAILSLAGNEATITSKLGATKVTLSDLLAASTVGDTDLFLTRQGTADKSVSGGVLKAAINSFLQVGNDAIARSVTNKLQDSVSVFDFMTDAQIADVRAGTLLVDVTDAVQSAITAVSGSLGTARGEVYFPIGRYRITGITLPSFVILRGPGEICPNGTGVTAITLTNTLYAAIHDLSINISQANQKAIRILGTGGSFSQLNNFYNVKIDSEILPAGSVGIEIDNSFSNSFFGVNILRVAKQVTFSNAANANHFYGGELRSNNTNPNGSNPIVHGVGCLSNGFHGTVIENQRAPILMEGGVLTIDSGCYIEAYFSAQCIQMNGGTLRIHCNYLNNGFIFINGGNALSVVDNTFDGSLSNNNYPFIAYRADVSTKLQCKGNEVLDVATPGLLLRARQWYDGAAWNYRAIANRQEEVENKVVRFQSRLLSDANDVTGDGTTYQIVWGGNEQFDDGSNVGSTFVAPENGIYWLGVQLFLNGFVSAAHDNLTVTLFTSNRTYQLYQNTADIYSTATRISIGGNALVDMEPGDTAHILITVSGSSKVIDVLRGDATNGFSVFSGFKVA